MNHVFKVKRNAKGQSVVASELAKSHSSVASKALLAVVLLVGATTAQAVEISSPQWIDIGSGNTTANSNQSTDLRPALEYAIGDNNVVDGKSELRYTSLKDTKADGSTITASELGKRKLDANGEVVVGQLGAIAIGSNNVAQGGQSVTVGFNNDASKVSHEAMTIIGSDNNFLGYSQANLDNKIKNANLRGVDLSLEDAKLDNEGGIYIGDKNTVEVSKSQVLIAHNGSITGTAQNAVGIGDETTIKSSDQAVTIGRKTLADQSAGAVSIGSTAKVVNAYGGTSLGLATSTTTANGVALGSFSESNRSAIQNATTAGEGASVSANEVYSLHIANDKDKSDILATVKGNLGSVSVGNGNATRQITNVAAGTADSDAVNVSQLQAVGNVVASNSTAINQLQVDVKAAKTKVVAGNNTTINETINTDGSSSYVVNAQKDVTKVGSGSDALVVNTDITDKCCTTTRDVTIDLSDKTKESLAKADSALQDIKVNVNGQQVSVINQGNPQVGFVEGKNITLGHDAKGQVTVATKDQVDFTKVTVGPVTIDATKGIDAGSTQVTNVKAGTKPTDAVNVSQLDKAKTDLTTYTNVKSAEAKTEVVAGTNTIVTESVGKNGQSIYKVDTKDTVVKSGSESVQVVNVFDPKTNTTTSSVGLTSRAEDGIDLAHSSVQSTNIQVNGKLVNVLTKDRNTQNFVEGKNIELGTDSTGSVVVKTKDDVSFTKVTSDSYHTGDVVISGTEVNVAGNQINNLAEGTKGTDAVNVNQLNTGLAKATTEVVKGNNTTVTKTTGTNGQSIYKVDSEATKVVSGSPEVVVTSTYDKGTNTTTSSVALSKDAQSDLDKARSAIQEVLVAIDGKKVNTITKDANQQDFVSGKNIQLSTDSKGSVVVSTKDDVEFQSVVAKSFRSGDVHISATEVNAGGNKVTNVAPGTISATSTDAINGSQLHQTNQNVTNLDNKVTNLFGDMQSTMDKYKKDLSAGIAGVNAAASLPQAHRAGQSSVAAALGYYNDQSALAVGVSTISDSGRWTIKGQVNMNTSGDLGAGAGVAYNF